LFPPNNLYKKKGKVTLGVNNAKTILILLVGLVLVGCGDSGPNIEVSSYEKYQKLDGSEPRPGSGTGSKYAFLKIVAKEPVTIDKITLNQDDCNFFSIYPAIEFPMEMKMGKTLEARTTCGTIVEVQIEVDGSVINYTL